MATVSEVELPTGSLANGYLNLDETYTWAHRLSESAPRFVKISEIGQSVEERPILALEIGDFDAAVLNDSGAGTGEASDEHVLPVAEVLFNSLHHSREPLSLMTVVAFTQDLVDKAVAGDASVLHLLRSRRVLVVPVVNPDGYEYNWRMYPNGGGDQRKNRRPTCPNNPESNGVDINRNYPFCFGQDTEGSSPNPCQEDYQGPAASSEPETRAMQELVLSRRPRLAVAFNYHSFGRALYIPNACKGPTMLDPDTLYLKDFASGLAQFDRFKWGRPWQMGLYSVNGDAGDWMFNGGGGVVSVSPEVSPRDPVPSDKYGFWPPADKIRPWALENLESNYYGSWAAGPMMHVVLHGAGEGNNDESGNKSEFGDLGGSRVRVINRGTRDTWGAPALALLNGTEHDDGEAGRDDGGSNTVLMVLRGSEESGGPGVLKGKGRPPRVWDTGLDLESAGFRAVAQTATRVAVWDGLDCVMYNMVRPDSEGGAAGGVVLGVPKRLAASACQRFLSAPSATASLAGTGTGASLDHHSTDKSSHSEGDQHDDDQGSGAGFVVPLFFVVSLVLLAVCFRNTQARERCLRTTGSRAGSGTKYSSLPQREDEFDEWLDDEFGSGVDTAQDGVELSG